MSIYKIYRIYKIYKISKIYKIIIYKKKIYIYI